MGKLTSLKRLGQNPWKTVNTLRRVWDHQHREPELAAVIEGVRAANLTYLSRESLIDLAEAVSEAERLGLEGAVVEAGVALGGSAVVLGRAKRQERPLYLFDAFGMIPPPSDKDGPDVHARFEEISSGRSAGIKGETYYGYRDDLLAEVTANLQRFGVDPESNEVTLVKGFYEDTMRIDFPVAVAHLDCDWYQSVMTCLAAVEPRLVPGGRLIVDDYYDWSGCTNAVDEFFAGRDGYEFVRKSRLHVVKQAG